MEVGFRACKKTSLSGYSTHVSFFLTNCACAETDLTFDLGACASYTHWTLPAIFTCRHVRDFNIFNALPEELLLKEVL